MAELTTKNCPVCFIDYAIPKAMADSCREKGGSWHCPNGHSLHHAKSENDTLRLERDRLKQNAAYMESEAQRLRDARDAAERRASAARGQVTKLKKRASAGVCPCCNRQFVDLHRHMAGKHPGFMAEEIAGDGLRTIQ